MMSDHSDDSDEDKGNAKKSVKVVCSRHCGLNAHRHEQVKHAREVEAALAGMGLLLTAQGGMPAKLELIVDVDVRLIPGSPGTPAYDLEVFRQTLKNERNRSKRKVIFFKDWTKIYSFLSELCVEACPSLYEELYDMCRLDIRGIPGGVFDGPLAYRMYMASRS